MELLALVIGWILAIFIGLLGIIIIWFIITDRINLEKLISEPKTGDASLSRFQFLLFTFVISMSLFLVIVYNKQFPEIPGEIFALLGISGGTYAVSKGIQVNRDVNMRKLKLEKKWKAAESGEKPPAASPSDDRE